MKLIDKAVASGHQLIKIGYTKTDIIRNMCPFELGLDEFAPENEYCAFGYEGCKLCWNREYTDKNHDTGS